MLILGIETACDDCAAAVVEDGTRILSNVVWGQKEVHERFGGIVPELAARRHAEVISLVVEAALREASIDLDEIEAVAVNNQHGLLRSVAVGVAAAKGLALGAGKKLIGVHHIEGHIYSAILSSTSVAFPHICLAVAGGHNLLILVKEIDDYEILGRSLDDAAGEAFDKVAKELGLGFPGGPTIDRLAVQGNSNRFTLPRPLLGRPGYDFSFSGLKTAVRELIKSLGSTVNHWRPDIAASFQSAVIEILTNKVLRAADDFGVGYITVVGGVAANSGLRRELHSQAASRNISVTFSNRDLCTDNAAMIAGLGYHHVLAEKFSDLTLGAFPNAPIGKRRDRYK
jgi:N6-L-threonylcarbamoyladenine synthase